MIHYSRIRRKSHIQCFLISHLHKHFRSNPLYDDNDSYFPGNPRIEPTSSVFAVASTLTESDTSSINENMTNSNESKVSNLQKDVPISPTEKNEIDSEDNNDTRIVVNRKHTSFLQPKETKDRNGRLLIF